MSKDNYWVMKLQREGEPPWWFSDYSIGDNKITVVPQDVMGRRFLTENSAHRLIAKIKTAQPDLFGFKSTVEKRDMQ